MVTLIATYTRPLALLGALCLPACNTAIIEQNSSETDASGEGASTQDLTQTASDTGVSGGDTNASLGSDSADPSSSGSSGTTGAASTGAETDSNSTTGGVTDGTDTDSSAGTDTTDTDVTDTDTDTGTDTDTDTGINPVVCTDLDEGACAEAPECMAITGALLDLDNKCKHLPAFIECVDVKPCADVISYVCPDGSDQIYELPNGCLPSGFEPCDPVMLEQICK